MTPQMKNFYKLEKRWIGGEVITHVVDDGSNYDNEDDDIGVDADCVG